MRITWVLSAVVVLASSGPGAGASAQQPTPLAELEAIGAGTPGSTGVPRLVPLGRPAILEPGMGLLIDEGLPGASALIIVGPGVGLTPLPTFGATLVPQLPALRIALGVLDADGRSMPFHSGPAPASPALLGLDFAVQGVVADPGAQGGAAFTQGLRLRFGAGHAAPGIFAGLGYRVEDGYAGLIQTLVTGDFDGNGRRDIVLLVAGSGPERIRLFRQLVDGSFAPPIASPLPAGQVTDGLAADVNGDSRLDLVFAQQASGSPLVQILHGLGDGRFASAISLAGPQDGGPCSLALADVTGEGTLDLLVSEWADTMLGVLPGCSLPATLHPLWGDGGSLVVRDVDGDDTLDAVALVRAPEPMLSVLHGLGGGSFATPALMRTDVDDPTCLELGDLDGDGDPDAVIGGQPPLSAPVPAPRLFILANDGSGGFAPSASYETGLLSNAAPTDVELVDVEPDGDLDVVVAHGLGFLTVWESAALLPNLGTGTLGLPRALRPVHGIDVVDMDADGRPDIAASTPSLIGSAHCYSNQGAGEFELPAQMPGLAVWPAGPGDFDGDGDLDLAGRAFDENGDARIAVSLWSEPDGFGLPTSVDAQGAIPGVDALVVGDVDHDGTPDVVVAGADTVRVFAGDGAGGVQAPSVLPLPLAFVPRIADMNADGRADLVVARRSQGLSVLLGQAAGGFAAAVTTVPAPGIVERFEVGDVDGDGRLDVVAQGVSGFHVLLGSGDGHFGLTFVASPGSGDAAELPLVLADFDADGDLDLARLDFTAQITIWSNDGQGSFSAGQQDTICDYTFTLRAADFNLDGALDLMGSDLRLGFGDGTFATPLPGIAADALGDFDADGDLDDFVNGFLFLNQLE